MNKRVDPLVWYFGFMILLSLTTLVALTVELQVESSCVAKAIEEGMSAEYIREVCK